MNWRWLVAVLILPLCGFIIGLPGGGGATISSVSLPSATGFNANGSNNVTIGSITVTTSDGSTPTLALSGTQQGSGNDASSFSVGSLSGNCSTGCTATLTATPAGGTVQPGQYAICAVASGGSYSNSPQQACGTIQSNGPGGAGWQLAFSDEFACPNNMLECLSTVTASSYTWSNSFCTGLSSPSAKGCGTLTVASLPSGISSANCTGTNIGACDISIAGATNGGTAGNSAVNGTFLVVGVPNSTTINLYMPYSGIAATMGGTITIGSGPWAIALDTTGGSTPGFPLLASNDNGGETEGWDPHACQVASANLFKINITNNGTWNGGGYLNASGGATNNYIPPAPMQVSGNGYTSTMCHIQAWNGTTGVSQSSEFYFDDYAEGPPGTPHPGIWTLTTTNNWPPEIDYPDFAGTNPSDNYFATGGSEPNHGPPLIGNGSFAEFAIDVSSSTITWYQASSGTPTSPFSASLVSADQGKSWYPIMDVTQDGGGNNPTFPSVMQAHYVRVYQKVASNACYSGTLPPSATSGIVPHIGTCAPPTIASVAFYPPGGCTGTPFNSTNPVAVPDNSSSGLALAQVCVTMSDGSSYDGTLSQGTVTPANIATLNTSTGAVSLGTATLSDTTGCPGTLSACDSIVATAAPGANEGSGNVSGTLYINVTPADPTTGLLQTASDGYPNWKEAGLNAVPFSGYIAGGTLNVTTSRSNALGVDQVISVSGLASGTTITATGTGTGNTGTYTLSCAPSCPTIGSSSSPVAMTAAGIPDRTTIYTTLSPNGTDDTSQINTALTNCPAGQVVLLTTGIFRVSGNGISLKTSGCTLRGSGPGNLLNTAINPVGTVNNPGGYTENQGCTRTSISGTTDQYCPDSSATQIIKNDRAANNGTAVINMGNNSIPGLNPWTQTISLASDAVQGTNTVTLASAPSPAINVGDIVAIAEDTADNGGDPNVTYWPGFSPTSGLNLAGYGCPNNHSLYQLDEVTAVNGTTITLLAPLTYPYHTAYGAVLYTFPGAFTHGAGVENMFLWGGLNGNIAMQYAAYSWVKNVDSAWTWNPNIGLYSDFRSVLRDSFIHETPNPSPGGAGYMIANDGGSSENLIENNISWSGNKVDVMRCSGGGNVFAYNYTDDSMDAGISIGGPEAGLNAGHLTTPHLELIEGNYGSNYLGDSYWGTSIYITMFRNYLSGLRAAAHGLNTVSTVNGSCSWNYGDWAGRFMTIVGGYSIGHSFVGNILGFNGQTLLSGPSCQFLPEQPFTQQVTTTAQNSSFGTHGGNNNYIDLWNIGDYQAQQHVGGGFTFVPTTINTTTRTANWEWCCGNPTTSGSETCYNYGTATGISCSGITVPNSFYLNSKPPFFGNSDTWPWVNPTTGAGGPPSSTAYTNALNNNDVLPAEYCFAQNKMPTCRAPAGYTGY